MIESMATPAARNIRSLVDGKEPATEASRNAICLADFGDNGIAFLALPQIPSRNVNWAGEGRWARPAKVAFEKCFPHKVRHGQSVPLYE